MAMTASGVNNYYYSLSGQYGKYLLLKYSVTILARVEPLFNGDLRTSLSVLNREVICWSVQLCWLYCPSTLPRSWKNLGKNIAWIWPESSNTRFSHGFLHFIENSCQESSKIHFKNRARNWNIFQDLARILDCVCKILQVSLAILRFHKI